MERAVLQVLGGNPLPDVAAHLRMDPTELDTAVGVFRCGGRDALCQRASARWWQVYVEFTEWETAESYAVDHLAPLLRRWEAEQDITGWWFIRKYPCWRLRLRPRGPQSPARIRAALDDLVNAGRIRRWWTGIYEPETAAFGGHVGIAIAHNLFHADSRAVLDLSTRDHTTIGRRELSILLCTALMRGAGLEWYEQGDVWDRVRHERPTPPDVTPERLRPMVNALQTLLLADTAPDGLMFGPDGPLKFAATWATASDQAGRDLRAAVRNGTLERGLRRILSYLVIFHWNRLGLSGRDQSALSWAARTAILDAPTPNHDGPGGNLPQAPPEAVG
ncbi:methyltransferase [Nocardiopsis gilva YIM 90087]|uniref:Methyltransferase n=1 Tax=Nocardiopsis gilva YIM 90087 TaxID=1235441 RepID=A0A223SCJ6_9ACTN|nr:thiopeptide-type bacteriocin biosynthesis protein [Nocardiopsis gilva]ASU85806.1 methyltransferase [Nocardiopsis gilva YIM 90087]